VQQGSFSDPSATAVATAACTGLRWGELRELRWGLFEPAQDEELAELHATRAAVARVGDPKTAKIETSVPLIPQLASDHSPTGKKADVLLWLLRGRVFAGRRNNSLEPQIRDHVPIVLIRVRRIDRKQGELRQVEVHEFHHLAALCIGHAVEGAIAVGNGVLERSYEISFRRFRFLDILTRICFASGLRAKRVGRVRHMANELAKTANIRCRFEGVVFFRHFLRRTQCRVADKRVEPSFARRNRIRWRRCRHLRLLLPKESNGNRR
jgi:hypothetical protein